MHDEHPEEFDDSGMKSLRLLSGIVLAAVVLGALSIFGELWVSRAVEAIS